MAEYTGGSSAITLYDGDQLTGSTVANIDYIGADAYTQLLYVSNGGLAEEIAVSSGGKLYVYDGGTANNVSAFGPWNAGKGGEIWVSGGTVDGVYLTSQGRMIVYGGEITNVTLDSTAGIGSTAQIRMQGAGVVIGGSNVANKTTEIYASGGIISNFTMNAGLHAFISNTAEFRDCTFSGRWIRGAGGTLTRITFLNSPTNSGAWVASHGLLDGKMVDCTIAAGAYYQMSGGAVSGLTISGANANFRVSGKNNCTLNDVNVYAGGSMNVVGAATGKNVTFNRITLSGGTAYVSVGVLNDVNVYAGGSMTLSGANAASKVTIDGLVASGAGNNRATVVLSNAVVDDITVHSGGYITFSAGASATDLKLIGNQTTETAGARIPYIYVSNGAQVVGGSTVDKNWHFLVMSKGYVENFIANTGGYFYISGAKEGDTWYYGTVSGGAIHCTFDLRGGMAINTVVDSGGVLAFARAMSGLASNVTIGSNGKATINSGGTMTDTLVSGVNASMTVNSGIASRTTVVSGGMFVAAKNAAANIQSATVGASGTMIVSGGTISDIIVSGADVGTDGIISGAAHLFVSGGTLNNLTLRYGVTGQTAPNPPQSAILNLPDRAGAVVVGGTVNNVDMDDAAWLIVSGGTVDGVLLQKTHNTISSGTSALHTRLQIFKGTVYNVSNAGTGQTEEFVSSGTISGFLFGKGAYCGAYGSGLVKDGIASGQGASLQGRGGVFSSVTVRERADMWMSRGTAKEIEILSGGSLRLGSNGTAATAGNIFFSGGFGGPKQDSGGKLYYDYYTTGTVSSGGVLKDSLIAPEAIVNIYNSGKAENLALRGRDDWTFETMAENMMARATVHSGGSWSGGDAISYAQMVVANGGRAEGITLGSNTHFYISSGGVAYNMVIDGGNDLEVRGGTAVGTIVKSGLLRVSSKAAAHNGGVVSNTVVSGGSMRLYFADAHASDTIIRGSGRIYGQNGTYENTFVSNGGYASALGGTWNNTVLSSGGSMRFYASGATINGITTQEGAEFMLDLARVANGAAAKIDTLAGVTAPVTVLSATDGYTYNLAEVGNENLVVRAACEGIYVNAAAGTTKINPYGRQYTLSADGTTLDVAAYTLEAVTTEAADLATSGAVINNDDKALRWDDVAMTSGSTITFVTEAAGVNGDAWMRINRAALDKGATLYGAEGNFGGTVKYLIHGAGTLGNFAAGAKAGGSVGGVELVSYNNDYGVTYLGGQGTVTGLVSAIISSGNTLSKDFYAGALANFAKNGSRTSVGSINATIRMRTDSTRTDDRVKGNIYGASQVKAGTIDTSLDGFTPIHTVGDVNFTLAGGTADKGDICVFAAGYANGTDSATGNAQKAVYTVDSVTAAVSGGNWGKVHGGRGIFGGAFAAGVRAEVANVDLTVSGGTMGNVYGGGWAQRGGVSAVGSVNISIKGGTLANVFGGGTTSISGGATEVGSVTITVSGGTITGDIFARGQMPTDSVTNAAVVFTGSNNFSCNVYGYSYVSDEPIDPSDATLRFTDYTGSFSGALGGFNDITFAGNTAMTLGTADADISNTAWIFDVTDRYVSLSRDALVDWSAADFTEDTVRLALNSNSTNGWSLVSGVEAADFNTGAGKFLVSVDGAEDIALTFDAETGRTDLVTAGTFKNFGFAVEDSTLKFRNLA